MSYEPIPGTTVIGIGNKARHGKDRLASLIIDMVEGARRYSFADDLKAYARVLGMKGKDGPLLQALGTDVFRRLDPDVWVRCLYWKIAEDRPRVAVLPDMRFPNEMQMVKDLGGTTVRVVRLNEDMSVYQAPDRDPNHASETALDDAPFDWCIMAKTGELRTLQYGAKDIVERLGL